ncbi:chemotaxis protein CheA [Marinomonas atlantica]|uniref:chemotaxis protein CheA n=1 Tax=Marinomonas atlantica TaxID=1806668 RepID=UPI0008364CF0|nr:chemotaxis protein CheA [Marinomonas atlantica]MCO4786487.1 chemotaxis protein CheA [Marinomonas atlantica]
MDNLSQFNDAFFEEAQEHLETMETLLLDYNVDAPDIEELNSVFRAAHSIKGGSAIFGFTAMTGLTHVMENMLDLARNEELELTNELITVLLETVDVLKDILNRYRNDEEIDWDTVEVSKQRLENELAAVASGLPVESPNDIDSSEASTSEPDEEDGFGFFEDAPSDSDEDQGFGFFDDEPPVQVDSSSNDGDGFGFFDENISAEASETEDDQGFGFFDENSEPESNQPDEEIEGFGFFDQDDQPNPETTSETVDQLEGDSSAEPKSAQSKEEGYGFFDEKMKARQVQDKVDNANGYGLYPKNEGSAETPKNELQSSKLSTKSKAPAKSASEAKNTEATSIRVETVKIDKLVNLVGELVITQSMLNLIGKDVQEEIAEKMLGALAELERNTREIQEAVMSVRMLPISFVFNRFPRLVRDLSVKMEKQIELVIEGASTEIDKNLVEKISDPLTHLIRNSVDHGIESPEIRAASGKSEKGTVRLSAVQKGGEIVISILDDGAGLNRERIVAKAEEKGIDLPDPLTDEAVWQLIFAPGFSTAAEVTDVSGRGVGMDVVRRNIESLGGRVEINSSQGIGTEFVISLPLTLAILDGMCVQAEEQIFVVPLVNIVESIQPMNDQIRVIKGSKILWAREEYWPLVDIGKRLGGRAESIDSLDLTQSIVVLVETAKSRFGLVVDTLEGQQQVVIKSLERHYRRVDGVAGATIMGDGGVALILDVDSLTQFISSDLGGASYAVRAAG